MLKKASRNSDAARKLTDEQIVELVMMLGGQVQDLSLRLEALRAIVERHGISHDEVERVYEQFRADGPRQILEGLKRARDEQRESILRKHEGTEH